jgi:hypothetical protein
MGRVKGWVCNACWVCVRHDSGCALASACLNPGFFFNTSRWVGVKESFTAVVHRSRIDRC